MSFVKLTLPNGQLQVINTDHIIRISKLDDKVEIDIINNFSINNLSVQQYNELMIELGVTPKPIRASYYKPDEPVL